MNEKTNTPGLRERKILLTKQKIREAAEKLFEEKGLNGVNFDEIAEAAIISRSTLYNYYENKQAVYFDLHAESVRKAVGDALQLPKSLNGKQTILMICDKLMTSFHHNWINSYILTEFIKESLEPTDIPITGVGNLPKSNTQDFPKITLKESIMEYFSLLMQFLHAWEKYLNKGIQDGSITTDLSIFQVMESIRMYLVGVMDQYHIQGIGPETQVRKLDFTIIRKITLNNIESILESRI